MDNSSDQKANLYEDEKNPEVVNNLQAVLILWNQLLLQQASHRMQRPPVEADFPKNKKC